MKGIDRLLPDPYSLLSGPVGTRMVALSLLPGRLDGDNILVDEDGKVGLTNLGGIGTGPLFAPLEELEAAFRFDWNKPQELQVLLEIDSYLVQHSFSRIQVSEAEPAARKALKAVQAIRRHAEELLNGEYWKWHAGMLFGILKRLEDASHRLDRDSTAVLNCVHLILAAGLTSQAILKGIHEIDSITAGHELLTDVDTQSAIVDGVRIGLTGQSFRLLQCMYERRETVCGPEHLVLVGLGENRYDRNDQSQANRLATAIRRLRDKIEPDPTRPTFLRTEAGGYRLCCVLPS